MNAQDLKPMRAYRDFLGAKVRMAEEFGFAVEDAEINALLKPHQRDIVRWLVRMGRAACFAAFGLGKSVIQIEVLRIILMMILRITGRAGFGLLVIPLGVRQEFMRDAAMLGVTLRFIRRSEEIDGPGIYLTNYESVRDGKLDPRLFDVASLDEASCLRGFGGTKTFREFMALFAGDRKTMNERVIGQSVAYRFVATATPSPNDFIELLAYSAFLGVMDVGQAKTRFFKRNSEKADQLTIHPHKEREFWLWCASWAIFVQKPSDLGHSDEGYELPGLDIHWHEIPDDHSDAGFDYRGQGQLIKQQAIGVVEAAREKRDSLPARLAKLMELRALDPSAHRVLWHDLEAERHALEKVIPDLVTVYGSQELDERETAILGFSDGQISEIAAKPVMLGSGCNLQRHCHWAIFMGIGHKFNDFIQAVHRLLRFLQVNRVRIDLIYTEAERSVRRSLEDKWDKDREARARMTEIIREYGLSSAAMADTLKRAMGVERIEVTGRDYRIVNNDSVLETAALEENSIDLWCTSVPFSTQYEYSPNYADFGHTDNNDHFFAQMDFLTPNMLRALKPGRIAAIHVKDRIVPGGMTGLGYQTVYPFHARCIDHYTRHGFGYMGMITIVTDVVRENNQTYRLTWSELCKDSSKMSCGMPEYLLLFRKTPSDTSKSYADERVVKDKAAYSLARWQVDAHSFWRSGGNRMLTPEELEGLDHDVLFRWFRDYNLCNVYEYEHHVRIGAELTAMGKLPTTFMLLQPPSHCDQVWTDVARMRTLNMLQNQKGKEQHLCLARGSRVLTKERGYVPIEDVQIGEHALTHRGRWRKVLVARCTGVQPVITVQAQGVPGLTLTPDHKMWTRKPTRVREREGAEYVQPDWTEAGQTLGAYVNFKLPEVESDATEDEQHWWIVGRWLADGHWDARGSAIISCGAHELESLQGKLGERAGAYSFSGTAYQIRALDPTGTLKGVLHRCGHGADGKHLPPEAFTLPLAQARALLDGYLSGDGHLNRKRQRWMVTAVGRDLLLGMAFLAQRVYGAVPSLYAGRPARDGEIQGRRVKCKQEWVLCFDLPSERRKKQFILGDGAWKKVRSLTDAGEAETWCLRVEEDESFTAEGCIVKNCPLQFDIVDRVIERFTNPGDVVGDPFGGIMSVPYRALMKGRRAWACELSPKYFTDGAHYCAAAERELAMPDLFATLEQEQEPA
jgi:hypothetical protein